MKTIHYLAFLILFVAAQNTSWARFSVRNVSKEQAKELGIELRAKALGPKNAWIELEFKAEGKLADFLHVSIKVADGDKFALGWTPLKDRRTSSGSVLVRVMGSRSFLERVSLRIVHGAFGGAGVDVDIRKFVDLDKLTVAPPKKTELGKR
jgi:hypothetical protein